MQKIFIFLFTILAATISLVYTCAPKPGPESVLRDNLGQATPAASKAIQATEWEKIVENAKKEGVVVLYGATGVSQARDPFIKAMKEKFGISVDATIAGGAELTTKLTNERRAGIYNADVYMGGASSMLSDLIPRDIFEPIEPYLILTEVKDPTAWFGGKLPFWEKRKVSLSTVASIPPGETAINNSLLKLEEFKSYRDLLNPKLKGMIVMSDPTISGAASSWFHLAYRLMGEDYLKELVKQDLLITRDFRLITEWLARGKYSVGIGINPGGVKAAITDGAPIAIMPPFKEGVALGMAGGNVAVMDKAAHPNATRVFVNWVLSKEGQTVFSRAAGFASRRVDVTPEHLDPWRIPDPKIQYVMDNEEYTIEELALRDVAKRIFEPVLK